MSISLENIAVIYPEQLLLEFSFKEKEQIWQEVQNQGYSNPQRLYNAFINSLCLHTILDYIKVEFNSELIFHIWKQQELATFWEIVNGSIIKINNTKLVIIPTEITTETELRVSREWLDINNWVGDYYLAVEINLEECWLRICGYASYEQLKYEGGYDAIDETYSLQPEELIEDINVLWTVIECYELLHPQVQSSLALSGTEAQNLLIKLSSDNIICPRLAVPFEQWSSFIGNDNLRQELYQRRKKTSVDIQDNTVTNLRAWLQNNIVTGWQSIQDIISNNNSDLAYSFRSFNHNQSNDNLEKIKVLDFNLESGIIQIALLMSITSEANSKLGIRVQLYPTGTDIYLPANIKLALETNSGKILQETTARDSDRLIQLKKFTCPQGKKISITVSLKENKISEDFIC